MRAGLVLIAALVLAGCGTTSIRGEVGDALKGEHLQAKLLAWVPTVPERRLRDDVTGLNTPRRGMRFAAVDVALCNDTGAAAMAWQFELRMDDGAKARPHQPTSVYENTLETVRDGCERGWVVFQIPTGARPTALQYEFDWSEPGINGVPRDSEHVRFDWSL